MPLPLNVRRVLENVLGKEGHSEQSLRQKLFDFAKAAADPSTESPELSPDLAPFMEKLVHHPYKMLDRDLETLKSLGYSEDQLFEMTLAGAIGAGVGRLSLTQRLIEQSGKCD
ncbi:MAG: hypothetical protein ACU84Q_08125 [Gammaproteobacteria bacterium]